MLTKLRVKNFRLLRDVEVEFTGPLTVFVGPNASGKSTVLEVLDFLARCAGEGLAAATIAHGGFDSIRTIGVTEPIEVGLTLKFFFEGKDAAPRRDWELDWTIVLDRAANGGARVLRESLTDSKRALLESDDSGARLVIPEDGGSQASRVKSDAGLAFEEVVDADRFGGVYWLRFLLRSVNVVGALSIAPAWARIETNSPSPRDSLVIGPKYFLDRQGVGLANVLYGLHTDYKQEWDEVERAFRGEFPFTQRIVFPPEVAGSKISFAFEDIRYPGRKLYASEMSDGMVAYLCLLAAVINPLQRGVLGLDEPDANLHPSALRRLVSLAHVHHTGRHLVIVTHSNALLDELHEPAVAIRIVEAGSNGAVIRKLDPDAVAAWRKDYTVSELRRTGLLDASNPEQTIAR